MKKQSYVLISGILFFNSYNLHAETLEKLVGISFNVDGVTIQVISNGCTKPQHFKLKKTSKRVSGDDQLRLSIVRSIRDRCRARPKVISLPLAIKLEKIHEIFVENKFAIQ